jgi:putative addiction module component (TIGR02574 family)
MNDVDRLLAEARKLSPDGLAELTDRLVEIVPEQSDPDIDEAWRQELRSRRAKIDSGETKLLAWQDVRAQLFSK